MTRRELLISVPLFAVTEAAFCTSAPTDLVGEPAPALGLRDWINSRPLEMWNLRGKVVLLRWWTEGCPYCAATAPALRRFHASYQAKGLQVIAVYHPKPPGKGDLDTVRKAVVGKQFSFPVAVDWEWIALKRWWLFKDRDFTSVSFLVDKKGIIRYVHPGGEFHEGQPGGMPSHASCQRDFATIARNIEDLLRVS